LPRLALIGNPLSHSFSKQYFEAKFSQLSLPNWHYDLWELQTLEELKSKLKAHADLVGFNVTIPYKVQIMEHCQSLSEAAHSIGAVNCVKVIHTADGLHLHGENTDVHGFALSLMNWYTENKKSALVFGNGGASKAALFVLNQMKFSVVQAVRKITVPNQILITDLTETDFNNCDLIVNCTPVGTFPKVEEQLPIQANWIQAHHQYYDMVYNPTETAAMQLFKAKGCNVKNGLDMLHLQADRAWEIWNS
jgi:shikimate dehydrogenase